MVLRWLETFAAEHARSAAAFSRTDARRDLASVEEGWSRYWALIRVGTIEAARGHGELARVHLEEAYRILAADTFVPHGRMEVAKVIVRKNRLVQSQSMAGDLAGAFKTAKLDVVRNGRSDHFDSTRAFGHAILCSRQVDVKTLERHVREQTSPLVRACGYFALAGRGVPHVTGMASTSLPDFTEVTDLRLRWYRLNSRWHERDPEEMPDGAPAAWREDLARNLGWYSVDQGAVRLLTTLTLSDKDARVRAAAARALGVTQLEIREAADLLGPGLQDSDGMVRLEVAKVLLRAGEPIKSIRDAVVALLSDGDDDLVALAAEVAGELHDASEPLVAALKEAAKRPDAYPRLFAARSMLTLDATRDDALDVLTKLLSCDNLWVAAKSAEALGALGIRGERAWGQLVSCLGQPDQYLQLHAAVVMMAIRGETAESTIALEWIYLNGSTPELRHWAATCLPWAIDQPAWEPVPLKYCDC